MALRSLNNPIASFIDYLAKTGTDAATPYVAPAGLTATGGVISDYTDPGPGTIYRAHIFTSSGTFQVNGIGDYGSNVSYLIVAGGGGGGNSNSAGHGGNGGGAAGGYVEGSSLPVSTSPGSYTITVGAGGASLATPSATPGSSRNGANSTISNPNITTLTAKGGGGGGDDNTDTVGSGPTVGSGGGSWGGGGSPSPGSAGQPGTNSLYGATDYGFAGGTGNGSPVYAAGGGGGAGGVGSNFSGSTSGNGGPGRASTIAYGPTNPVTYAGGGGGGNSHPAAGGGGGGTSGSGGPGGGGAGGNTGTYATGGGGGGVPGPSSTGLNISGGSGIVVVRYQISQLTAQQKATGGAVSFYGNKTIHTFTSSGTFNAPSPISNVEVVVVAGGGGGGYYGGGGGAGGYRYYPNITVTSGPKTVTVGSGGAGGYGPSITVDGSRGGTSLFIDPTYDATGGGGSPSYLNGYNPPTQPGGSGGGARLGDTRDPNTGGTGNIGGNDPNSNPIVEGYAGGDATNNGAGGGGAGGVGGPGTSAAGHGGIGVQLPPTFRNPASQPSPTGGGLGAPGPGGGYYWVAGGGGGSFYDNPPNGQGGGPGGPYAGGAPGSPARSDGWMNTGGGGGGLYTTSIFAGSGGSGIVLIAYPS